MKNKLLTASVVLASALLSHQALAVPFSSFDPRSFAMGGVGVAAGTSANAVFFNPALLAAATNDDDFSIEMLAGARVADPGDFIDAVDTFNSNNSIKGLQDAILAADFTAINLAANQLKTDLIALSQKPVQVEADVGFVVGVPSKKLGISVFSSAWVVGGVEANILQSDLGIIDAIITALPLIPADPTSSFNSTINARFAAINETGIAIARRFGSIAVGITSKYVQVTTNDYKISAADFDTATIDLSQGEVSDSNVNFDIGLARDFGDGWKTGFSVKNILAQEYTTVLGNVINIEPMARFGVMHETSWSVVALDIDLTENAPVGFDTATQYVALGLEFDLFDTAQLRFGVRHNMSDTPYAADMLSAGIGLSPFGLHIDVSVAGNEDEVGAAVQLGFSF